MASGKPGRPSDSILVKQMQAIVNSSNKVYGEWEDDFDCELIEDYIEGNQWEERLSRSGDSSEPKEHYTINKILANLNTRMPSLIFYRPKCRITPLPAKEDDKGEVLSDIGKMYEDTAYTFMRSEKVGFLEESRMAVRDAQSRFGVCEVGYTTDYVDNPNSGKPMLKPGVDDTDPTAYDNESNYQKTSKGTTIPQPKRVPKSGSEMLYVRRIPACQFRFSPTCGNDLREADGLGYYTWEYLDDLRKNPNYDNTEKLKDPSGKLKKRYLAIVEQEGIANAEDAYNKANGMVKVWRWWDKRAGVKRIWVDDTDFFLKKAEPFDYVPLAILRHYLRPDKGPYPIPPAAAWLSPQDEYNEVRDTRRIHRRRSLRRYLAIKGRITEPELQKIEAGGDGTIAWAEASEAMEPVPDAPLDRAIMADTSDSRTDFSEVSGIPAEARGLVGAATATQANIIDTNSKIRDFADRDDVAIFLSQIIKLMLLTIRDNMSLKFWIQVNADPRGTDFVEEALRVTTLYKLIHASDLGDFDFDVEIDVQSMTPVTDDLQRNQWTQFLTTVANPQAMIALSASEVLLKKTAGLWNIRSEKEIQEIQKAFQAVLLITVPQAAGVLAALGVAPALPPGTSIAPPGPASPGGPGGPSGAPGNGGAPGPMPPPAPGAIPGQLNAQVGLTPGKPA